MTDLDTLRELAAARPGVRVFLFGSFARGEDFPHDIDILVIYDDQAERRQFRDELEAATFELPLDVLEMTPGEEKHFDFVASQNARPVLECVSAPRSM